MARLSEKFFHPKVHTGWHKEQSLAYRRRLVQKAHKNNLLASGRAMLALSNVSKDPTTAKKAKQDANYFFKKHKERKNG